jgi:extracellular factor (EF) 3-hydroxypalmitic acid methyl ester biosynthesis protein
VADQSEVRTHEVSNVSACIRRALPAITRADADLISEIAVNVTYRTNDVILSEGEIRQTIFVIESGTVRAQTNSLESVIAIMEPGQVFGEISLIDNDGASLSIFADEDCAIAVIDGPKLAALLESVPGLSSRFYRSLALVLVKRLRRLTRQVAPSFSWG